MLLSKEVAVELNLTGCKQFILIDLLWNQGSMSQQQIADQMQKGISILDEMLIGISEEELRSFLVTLGKLNRNMTVADPGL